MKKYRKKPVVIEAMEFKTIEDYVKIVDWMQKSGYISNTKDKVRYKTPIMYISTLEGTMAANPGDYIIKGVKGEFYPCKPEIFKSTYEEVLKEEKKSVKTNKTIKERLTGKSKTKSNKNGESKK